MGMSMMPYTGNNQASMELGRPVGIGMPYDGAMGINNPQMGSSANDPDVAFGGQDQIYSGMPTQIVDRLPGQMPGQFPYETNRPVGIGMPYYTGETPQPMIMPYNPIQTASPSLFAQPAPTPVMQQPAMPQPVIQQTPQQVPSKGNVLDGHAPMPQPGQFAGGLRPAPRGYRPPARNLMAMRRGLMR